MVQGPALKNILKIDEPSPGHFYWPILEVDLTEKMIEHPDRFPLKAKHIAIASS